MFRYLMYWPIFSVWVTYFDSISKICLYFAYIRSTNDPLDQFRRNQQEAVALMIPSNVMQVIEHSSQNRWELWCFLKLFHSPFVLLLFVSFMFVLCVCVCVCVWGVCMGCVGCGCVYVVIIIDFFKKLKLLDFSRS